MYTPKLKLRERAFAFSRALSRVHSVLLLILLGGLEKVQQLTTLHALSVAMCSSKVGHSARNGKIQLQQFHPSHHQSTNTITRRSIVFDYQSISFAFAFPLLHYLHNWELWAVHPSRCSVLPDIISLAHKRSWEYMLYCYRGLFTIHRLYKCTVKMKSNAVYWRELQNVPVSSVICLLKIH